MKVFFAASTKGNTGPANANRGFLENWPAQDDVRSLFDGGKLMKALHAVRDAFWCDVVVSGGGGTINSLIMLIAEIRSTPVVGYCHGYVPFENEVNRQGLSESQVRAFVDWLDRVDVVATNSDLQRRFLEASQPSLSGKVESTLLGMEAFRIFESKLFREEKLVIAASGGTRPIKGNDIVAQAVLLLKERGVNIELRVYGRDYIQNPELDKLVASAGLYRGQVPQSEFVRELREVDVFVMNSCHEPFGLSALDALEAGCSLLLSKNCGVKEVFETEACDVVLDHKNVEEVAEKIAYLAEHPNCERLYSSIDFESCSWPAAASRLRDACIHAAKRKREE